jgi:hypothetical protein
MHEQEACYDRESEKSHGPPEFQSPRSIGGDVRRECWACDASKVQAPVEGCEGPTSLVEEEKINQNSWAKDSSNTTEEPGEESGDDEAVELIFVDHQSSPYLCEEAGNQCPEYD